MPISRSFTLALILAFAGILGGSGRAVAQIELQPKQVEPPAVQPVTPEVIESRRKQAEESQDLDDDTKKKIADFYRQAAEELKRAIEAVTKAAALGTDADNVRQRVEQIRTQLDQLKSEPVPSLPEFDTLAELKQELARQEVALVGLKDNQAKAEAESTRRANRRKEIRTELFSAPDRLAEVKRQLEAPAPADEPPLLTLARRTELRARLQAIEQQIPALQNELAMFDAEEAVDLVRLDRELKTEQARYAAELLRLMQARVGQLEAEATREALRKAQEEAIRAQPLLQPYAEQSREYAELADALTGRMQEVQQAFDGPDGVKQRLEALQKQFEQTKSKVNAVGMTSAIGSMLRRQRATLPNVRQHRQNVRKRRDTINDAQFQLLRYDDLLRELPSAAETVGQIIADAPRPLAEIDRDELLALTEHARERRSEYLNRLIRNYNAYFDALIELDNTEQQLIKLTDGYTNYINELVLWIRSGKLLRPRDLIAEREPVAWLFDAGLWIETGQKLGTDAMNNLLPVGVALAVFGCLFYFRMRVRDEIKEIGGQVERSSFSQIGPTLRAACLTVVIAGLWPGVVWYLAWRLNVASSSNGSDFAKAAAQALSAVAAVFFPMEVFRQVCRRDGLAEAHFEWPKSAVRILRRNLHWLMPLVLPLVFLIMMLAAHNPEQGRDSLVRVLFVVAMLLLAWFLRRVLHPLRGVFKQYIAYHQGGWIDRLKHVWCWLAVSAPLVLAALAVIGYYYTAGQLAYCLHATIWLLAGLVVIRALLLRWLLMHRRKLSIEQARQRAAARELAAAEQTAAQSEASNPASTPAPQAAGQQTAAMTAVTKSDDVGTPTASAADSSHLHTVDESPADLTTISEQTSRLLNTALLTAAFVGLWLIWVDVLPALNILDRWTVWSTTVKVTEPIEGADGTAGTRTVDVIEKITAANLVFAALIAVITIICARNIPGLLEMSLLGRLPLENSVRYAITRLASYVIVLIGVIVACGAVGLSWTQIQWLATALTFGLAFGLQEIFANFVSGLIILFERPIRVGDVVTIDEVTGIVSRVRIRATTITNWDRKEYVIPNKEFITGRMLNWTLSDKVNRIVINVGIAYGSDTQRATELLLKVTHDHPATLDNPPSIATFEGFGDNSLNFTLRTFLPTMDNRLPVIHELHTAIDQAFREAGIEIAFPQRDLHIKSVPDSLKPAPEPWTGARED